MTVNENLASMTAVTQKIAAAVAGTPAAGKTKIKIDAYAAGGSMEVVTQHPPAESAIIALLAKQPGYHYAGTQFKRGAIRMIFKLQPEAPTVGEDIQATGIRFRRVTRTNARA